MAGSVAYRAQVCRGNLAAIGRWFGGRDSAGLGVPSAMSATLPGDRAMCGGVGQAHGRRDGCGGAPALLPAEVDAVIDACDQSAAKTALAAWSLASGVPLKGSASAPPGGKRLAQRVEVEDLADASHDPLLAGLRQRLRKAGLVPRQGRIGLRCVFSREAVAPPADTCGVTEAGDGSLNCHGYGSSVTVTATFGMVAAGEVLTQLQARARARHGPCSRVPGATKALL